MAVYPEYYYVALNGRKVSNNPMCERCVDRVNDEHEDTGEDIVAHEAGSFGGKCIHCGTDYEEPEEQRRLSEYRSLKALYWAADRHPF